MSFGSLACNEPALVNDPLASATVYDVMIETSPAVLDFGMVAVNTEQRLTLTLRNKGTRELKIEGLSLDRLAPFEVDAETPFTLGVGEVRELSIRYRPTGYEATSANLVVESTDPILPEVKVGLAGRCDPPKLDLSPLSYGFGQGWIGCQFEQPLYLRNRGGSPLEISRASLTSSSSELKLTLDQSLPLVVPPGEQRLLTLSYTPLDEVADSATLRVDSNDPELPLVTGSFSGQGRSPGLIRDVFGVDANGKVDILFVVDNSGSMSDNQQNLVNNFGRFYKVLQELNLDWQIGVVTTDNGVLQGRTRIITPSTPDIQGTFSENALVGTAGSGDEKGLEFAYQALSEPLVSSQNRGFLRPDAGLRIITLSDEEDYSSRNVDFYVSFFQNLKVSPRLVTFNGITGEDAGCNTSCGAADPARRYADAVEATGGITASICTCDFISALEALAADAQVYQDTFPLSQTPVEATLKVTVNGQMRLDWTYDAALNAVVFATPEATPQNGEDVVITYELLLTCSD
ncbi:MAG: choice-of-anchor D domain-containing protein [Myxococcota bacterium]